MKLMPAAHKLGQRHVYHWVTFLLISVIASRFFGALTAPRAFELSSRFKRSQFGTDLRQCFVYQEFLSLLSSFFCHSLYSVYFAINLNGEMLIGENESHDYSATLLHWRYVGLKMDQNCPSVKLIKLMICVG